jgi:release factor glutamine methyltransferase
MHPFSIAEIKRGLSGNIDPHEVDIFIMHAAGKTREFVLAHPEFILSSREAETLRQHVRRRMEHEPVAYIVGHKEFFGLDFEVDRHTLVPRPETELVVESILRHESARAWSGSPRNDPTREKVAVIDVGTGSGNIVVSLAKHLPGSELPADRYEFIGIDLSPQALKVARRNAKRHGVGVRFIESDLLENPSVNETLNRCGRAIVAANLPYLSKAIYESAMPDVKDYEPKSALYSPEEGLCHYRRLLEQAEKTFGSSPKLHATFFLEIGPEQKKLLPAVIARHLQNAKSEFAKDLAGKWRLAVIEASP